MNTIKLKMGKIARQFGMFWQRLTPLLLVILICCMAGIPRQTLTQGNEMPVPATHAELEQAIQKIMRAEKIPGVSVALVEDGQAVWVKGLGMADLESQKPMTAGTIVRAGSISKMFAGLDSMKLVYYGALFLDVGRDRLVDLDLAVKAACRQWLSFSQTCNTVLRSNIM